MNRETWLTTAVAGLGPLFTSAGYEVPEVRVSVGWPSRGALSVKKRVIGQCWYGKTTGDEIPQIFISPALEDRGDVLATLVHEMLHAVVGSDAGHKGPFRKGMKALGLEGKPTATHAGEKLAAHLVEVAERIGEFPHSKISASTGPKQSTRLIKAECPVCGYTVRVTRKWLEVENPNDDYAEAGAPICPIDRVQMTADW